MGEMRDSDWSKKHMLRSDWLRPIVATITTSSKDESLVRLKTLMGCLINSVVK